MTATASGFQAVFEDGEESEAEAFDFCEEDLELEF